MSAEKWAERFADLATEHGDLEVGLVDEDMRTGGFFFEFEHAGRFFEVLVRESWASA